MIELSVIIPTYNRKDRLRACLEALGKQTQPASDFEVIVVSDGSVDGTTTMLATIQMPYRLCALHQENSGQNVARNKGAEIAQGLYFLFIDDDIIADPGLVTAHLDLHRKMERVVGIGQMTLTIPADADAFTRSFAQGWVDHYTELNKGLRKPAWTDCFGGNLSVSRAEFIQSGGFAPDIPRSHDIELGYRLQTRGLCLVYLHNAIGHQDEHKGLRELVADAEKSGRAWVTLYQRHPPVLPDLLGWFGEAGRPEVLLRRSLLALNIPGHLLALIGPLFRKNLRAYKWYRFVHSYSYWRGVRQACPDREMWQKLTHGTAILMYHAIGGPDELPSKYVLPTSRFTQQMALLKYLGYTVLSLEEYIHYRREYKLPPARSVVLTFDDGYADNHENAYPILKRHGYPATIFLVSGKVGRRNDWAQNNPLAGRKLMDWTEIKSMHQDGIAFGAHTRNHLSLKELTTEQAIVEVKGSREDIENKLNTSVLAFAYPYGEYDQVTSEVVVESGFLGACTIDRKVNGHATPLDSLRRIEVFGTDSLLQFLLNLQWT